MKDAYYFSHDCNARNDTKILAMRSKYGSEGYGWYWMVIEILREQSQYKLKNDKYLSITLAMQLQCDSNTIALFMNDCIKEYNLFQTDEDYIWSDSLIRRMNEKEVRSENAKKAANARWGKILDEDKNKKKAVNDTTAMRAECDSNTIKESKVKESKIKEIKEEENNSSDCSSDFNIFKYMQQCGFVSISPLLHDKVQADIEIYSLEEVKKAIEIADNSGKHSYNYVKGILEKRRTGVNEKLEKEKAQEQAFKEFLEDE